MRRSFLLSSFFVVLLAGCKDKTAHRPANPFIYTILNKATITDGKDTVTKTIDPGFDMFDTVDISADGTPSHIIKIESNPWFRVVVLPVATNCLSEFEGDPHIFKAYRNGDTLFLCQAGDLPNFKAVPGNFKDFKQAIAVHPKTGKVVCWVANNTDSVGDSIDGYIIRQIFPFTETVQIEFPEEMGLVSSDPKKPDLMQTYLLDTGIIKLGFYNPKIHSEQ